MLDTTIVSLNLVVIISYKESRDTLSVVEFIIYRTALAITLIYYLRVYNLRLNAVTSYYTGILDLAL